MKLIHIGPLVSLAATAALFAIVCLVLPQQSFALIHLGSANTASLSNGLVGYWPLDGATTNWRANTTADISGNSYNGILGVMTTSTTPAAGHIGGAFSFNGSTQYVDIPSTSLSSLTTGSISVWVYPLKGAEVIASQASAAQNNRQFTAMEISDAGNGNFKVGPTAVNTVNTVIFVCTTNNTFSWNKWHHFVYTSLNGSGKFSLYVDGQLQTSFTCSSGSITDAFFGTAYMSGDTVQLGAKSDTNFVHGNFFSGRIDDVRIYNRVLKADEIAQLYKLGTANAGHSNTTAVSNGLVGYWTFDGGVTNWTTGTTQDVSGTGNTGSLSTMSTSSSPTVGKIGQAFTFNGSTNYVQVSSAKIISGLTNWTMSAWIKTSVSKIAGGRAIYAERATSGSDIVKLDSLDDTSKTNAFITVRNDAATLLQVRGSKTINDNKWHLITGVKNGTSVYLYVDGAQDGTTDVWAGAENFTNAGIVSLIAADALGPSFTGAIDDVRIYTRALGRDEVQQLYHLGAANAGHSNENFMSEGLVGYWTFDGNTINWRTNTFNDISGNGNNATTTTMSTSTSPVAGKIGQALKFNASGYLTISDSASLDPTAAVSMSVWANTNVVANGQVISKYNALSSSDPYEIQFWNDGEIYGNFSTTGGPISVMHCPYAINTWYHIVATYDGIRAKLYLNGKQCAMQAAPSSLLNNFGKQLFIGSSGGSTPFNGTIDDVRIYNRALSAGEVAQLYKAGR